MDFEFEEGIRMIIIYLIITAVVIGTMIAIVIGLKHDIEEIKYRRECERKAILYDYIMEQNGDGE